MESLFASRVVIDEFCSVKVVSGPVVPCTFANHITCSRPLVDKQPSGG